MARVQMMLQGKGGVGKSLCSALLAQYFAAGGAAPICFDTDPVNQTFEGFGALNVRRLPLGDTADEIDPRRFDDLIEAIFALEEAQALVIVDNGASSFLPLAAYLAENGIVALLRDGGHEIRFHTIVTGGQALDDTLLGVYKLVTSFPEVAPVVWVNAYFGRVQKNGLPFEQFDFYREHAGSIGGLISLPRLRRETYGHDIATMLERRQTFDEAIVAPEYNIVARARLRRARDLFFAAIGRAKL